jgi:aspartyl-tRNA(Asn)/glutamyl-tRNA(Gln) amidotransferase subunit B
MRSPEEAVAYARKIHQIVRWIGISDGNMQEGSFRMDANISLRPLGTDTLGTRAEIKNINSFRFLDRALRFEIERQSDILESGGKVVQETRLYDADRDETRSMRSKEEANDYRYFPDPDLLPLVIDAPLLAAAIRDLPELPDPLRARFRSDYGLADYDANLLTASRALANYFEEVATASGDAKLAANWIGGEVSAALNKAGLEIGDSPVSAAQLAGLIARVQDQTLSSKIAKQVFEAMWNGEGDADAIIATKGLKQITDTSAIEALIDGIIAANPTQVEQYRAGKDKVFGFFVGQVMKASKGPGQSRAGERAVEGQAGGLAAPGATRPLEFPHAFARNPEERKQ